MGNADAVPTEVRTAAYDAIEWLVPGVPVADLFYDTVDDALDRPPDRPRWLRFRHREQLVELRVERPAEAPDVSLTVQVLPPRRLLVQVGRPGSRASVRTTSAGRAQLRGVRAGWADVLLRRSKDSPPLLKTATVRL